MNNPHMDINEVAEYLKVHRNTIYKYVHHHNMPVLKFPGRNKMIFRKDLVDEWVLRQSQPEVYVNGESKGKAEEYGKLRVLMP